MGNVENIGFTDLYAGCLVVVCWALRFRDLEYRRTVVFMLCNKRDNLFFYNRLSQQSLIEAKRD